MQTAISIVFVGALVFLAHLFSAIFSRTKIPDVLWLFSIGVVLGPMLGIVTPASFGVVGPVFTTVTLVFILFESGMDLQIGALERSWRGTSKLTFLGFLTTMLVVAVVCYAVTPLGVLRSLILGSIVGGTSAAVVIPMASNFALGKEASTTLVLESTFTDVFTLAVPLALIVAYQIGEFNPGTILGQIVASLVLAVLIGGAAALAWSLLLGWMRNLKNSIFTTPAFVFIVFGVVELLGYSGPIAALTFGVTLANVELFRPPLLKRYFDRDLSSLTDIERAFFSEVVFLLRTFFFVYVGASLLLNDPALILLGFTVTVLLFLVRIPVVAASVSAEVSARDASIMAVMIPKGLGAAVLATVPVQQGIEGGETIQTVTFAMILFSTILTTALVFLISRTRLSRVYETVFIRLTRVAVLKGDSQGI